MIRGRFGMVSRVSAMLAATGLAILLAPPAAAGVGEDFGSRDPAICPLRDAPAKGPPSFAQIIRYLACDMEKVGDMGSTMYLLGEVRMKMAPRARAYDARSDAIAADVDASQPVYAIAADFRIYQCGRKSSAEWLANPGRACRYQNFYGQPGLCWKAIGGDWHCALSYQINPAHTVHSVAPPKAGNFLAIGAAAPPLPGAAKSRVKKRKQHHHPPGHRHLPGH